MKMIRKSVKSSNVISVGYDEVKKILEVEFTKGGVYKYYAVSKEIYFQFLKAPSIGKFVHSKIRGRYRYEKM